MGRHRGRTDKLSETVCVYIIRQIFEGKLRTGDRLDRDAIANALDISRSPVQEALHRLERDGLVLVHYQRGAYVATFDERSILERCELYGTLSAMASVQVATHRTPEVVHELHTIYSQMRRLVTDFEAWDEKAWEFRHVVNKAGGGPALLAFFKGFSSFMPQAFRLTWPRGVPVISRYFRAELQAIESGDPDGARAAVIEASLTTGRLACQELERRGVIEKATKARTS